MLSYVHYLTEVYTSYCKGIFCSVFLGAHFILLLVRMKKKKLHFIIT
jgi:hypothetical protein